ncbi:MAG: DUF58 domain-containing protein [Rhodospirillaceae bacterium]|nr:DUF58 domain-containing protein [Rhodospirillaceae bacterium]
MASPARAALAAQQRAEQLASTLPPLLVAAERVAATVEQGVHGRRRVGPGETFWQFRRYEPGDPTTKIDWRQSAKSDRTFVREMEWAAAQSVWLWRDGSASMRYRSADTLPQKIERADLVTLALATLLVRGGERVALLGSGLPPASGRALLGRLALQLARAEAPEESLPRVEPLPRHASLVLVGDFLSPLEEIESVLRRFAQRGVRGHLLQILDPAEESLPFTGRIRFLGVEGEGETLLSRVETVRQAYVDRLKAHREGLGALARAIGWSLSTMRTDRPPQAALLALYLLMSEPRGLK